MTGRLIGIARAAELRSPLEELPAVSVSVEAGIAGDARGRKPGRQVTVLFRESWDDACRELGVHLPWVTRRANLLVEGLPPLQAAGAHLKIGETVLEVTMQTDPCFLMEKAHKGLKGALTPAWRGGICCKVVSGGTVKLGDAVARSS